jgi:hypothetical protein
VGIKSLQGPLVEQTIEMVSIFHFMLQRGVSSSSCTDEGSKAVFFVEHVRRCVSVMDLNSGSTELAVLGFFEFFE